MKILVAGRADFIGSYYVRTLLTRGYPGFDRANVTVLDMVTYAGNLANLEKGLFEVNLDRVLAGYLAYSPGGCGA